MTAHLRFHGGSDEVTGSRHLLEVGPSRILMDCGLFQGHRREAIQKNTTFPAPPASIHAVLLSHAHIDHSGGLPLLVKNGFAGKIHCTEPTAELARIMLYDSAHLQEEDARYFNKVHQDEGISIEPLYDTEDVERLLGRLVPHPYDETFEPASGVRARFLNAGHVLGSAMIDLDLPAGPARHHLVFTGDLGRHTSLLMRPPQPPPLADTFITESTYGGRSHPPFSETEETLAGLIRKAAAERGRILIPSFALERTQELVYLLGRLQKDKRIPPIHLYVDSPMAADITDVFQRYARHPSFSDGFHAAMAKNPNPFGFGIVRYVRSVEESKALNDVQGPHIVLAASGMCEGGRILHHLRNSIGLDTTTIILVGYQAQGTLGRRLAEGAKKVKIFGLEHDVRASVQMMTHLSSHADEPDLVGFVESLQPRPRMIYLVHGDEKERQALRAALAAAGIDRVTLPRFGESYPLA